MIKTFPRGGFVLWFTGLSGAGKSTLAEKIQEYLSSQGYHQVELLDGDVVRKGLSQGLGFSRQDRETNIARVGYVAKLLSRNGVATIGAFISPYREMRETLRQECTNFIEIYLDAPLAACEARDTKGLYAKARRGEIQEFTGISDPYDPPEYPELVLHTHIESVEASTEKIIDFLVREGYIIKQ